MSNHASVAPVWGWQKELERRDRENLATG